MVATGTLTCPVAALRTWLEAADITDGAVFRAIDRHGRIATGLSGRAIALIVKRRAAAAGVNPTGYSAHSLRAGCATEAAARGVEERDISRHTRHRSILVLGGYIRAGRCSSTAPRHGWDFDHVASFDQLIGPCEDRLRDRQAELGAEPAGDRLLGARRVVARR